MTKLLDLVADARTPADALRAVRDWLEGAGMPTAAMAVHREVTDYPVGWEGGPTFKVSDEALNDAHMEGYAEGKAEGEAGNDYDDGYEDGFQAGVASMTPSAEEVA